MVQNFVPALDHRTGIYMWPNPFHQVYYGNPKYDGRSGLLAPRSSTFVAGLHQLRDGTSPWLSVFEQIIPEFRVIARTSNYVLYERITTETGAHPEEAELCRRPFPSSPVCAAGRTSAPAPRCQLT